MNIGAPHSPARWLSENIDSLDPKHNFALMESQSGRGSFLVTSGTKAHCQSVLTDLTKQVVCDLRNYRSN